MLNCRTEKFEIFSNFSVFYFTFCSLALILYTKGGESMFKSKQIKSFFAVLLVLTVLFIPFVKAEAKTTDDSGIMPLNTYIRTADSKLVISGITATCHATVRTDTSVLLKITMELQKKKSDGYTTVKTWSSSKTGTYITMMEKRNINILCDYRLKATLTAGNETRVIYRYSS